MNYMDRMIIRTINCESKEARREKKLPKKDRIPVQDEVLDWEDIYDLDNSFYLDLEKTVEVRI